MHRPARLRFNSITLIMVSCFLFLVEGCATTQHESYSIESASAEANQWITALAEGKIDRAVSHISNDFASASWPDRAALADYLHTAQQRGYFDNASVSFTQTSATTEGDRVRIYPVHMRAQLGTAVFALMLQQEKDNWRIVSLEMEIY